MKLTFVLMLTVFLQVSLASHAQKITYSGKDVQMKQVFEEIQKQTNYNFLYTEEMLKGAGNINLNVNKESLKTVLDKLFEGSSLTYTIHKNIVVVKRMRESLLKLAAGQNSAHVRGIELQLPANITGKVTDSRGEPLTGVSVRVKGTSTGVSTNAEGNFSLNGVPENAILVFTYLGFTEREVSLNGRTALTVQLTEDMQSLGEVVVTALGVTKERKALGYSVTEVKGEELTQAREINVGSSLVGKVAGLDVSSVSGGPGSSVNIQIRGMSSISQSNQPLYVVNGVPMTNETSSGRGQFQSAPDRGDNIGNINPDDIESISVLKGAAASALYGSRAKAGVILITTKSGKAGAPASIDFNSNYVISQVVDPSDFQYEYGQGSTSYVNGAVVMEKPTNVAQALSMGMSSWGPKMDGQPYIQVDGVMRPYSPATNNVKDFFRDGGTFTNTVSFTKGFEQGSVRVSASLLGNTNVMPNSGLERQTFNVAANYNLTKRLNLDVRANYILEQGKNRARLGDNTGNASYGLFALANTININDFKSGVDAAGNELNLSGSTFTTNPWFAAKYFKHNTNRNRLITSATMKYTFDNGVFIQGRAARDFYSDRYSMIIPTGAAYQPTGRLDEQQSSNYEINADILAGKTFKINDDLSISPNIGASYRNIKGENFGAGGIGFAVPYVYYLGNVPNRTVTYGLRQEQMQAAYGTLELNYKDLFYLTGTGRTDWFSTLATPDGLNPVDKFYPSVSSSFVFSELLAGKFSWLSFGKLRAGYAVVGQATGAYQTSLTYGFAAVSLGSFPIGNVSNGTIPNARLKPSEASELEIGTELRFFRNRLSVDFTWYRKTSTNEIVSAPTSSTSGYNAASLNIGKLQNTGVEALISISPFKSAKGFNWTTSINGATNDNQIIALAPDNSPLTWATARSNRAFIQHRVGEAAGQVVAYDYLRDASGNIQVNPTTGLALPSTVLTSYGSAYHKWLAGWNNDFSIGKLTFGFLIDGKFGGKIYSNTETTSMTNGRSKRTLEGRDQVFGVNRTAQQYYSNLTQISSLFISDADFIKFRQMTLGYSVPVSLFKGAVKNLHLSAVGRNLFILMRKTENIDPEAAYAGDAIGLEMGVLPPQRTFGLNISAKF